MNALEFDFLHVMAGEIIGGELARGGSAAAVRTASRDLTRGPLPRVANASTTGVVLALRPA